MKRLLLILLLTSLLAVSCTGQADESTAPDVNESAAGSLVFVANGEDFVRQGFVSKDGWQIDFDHVYVTVADVSAYQTDPPFDASSGDAPDGEKIAVAGPLTLDLAEGDENAAPLVIETVDAAAGQYNALGWQMVPAADGDAVGATVLLIGTAQKDGQAIDFTLRDATEYAYNCGEFVGDTRKGIVQAGTAAEIEATFHFDHVFGDADTDPEEALNIGALGFDPLAALADGSQLDISVAELADLLSADEYAALTDTLSTLGHVGEGHCFEATGGYTGHKK